VSLLRRILLVAFANLALFVVLIAMVEGTSSVSLKIWDAVRHGVSVRTNVVKERIHTRYDPLLGWVNIPHFFDPDLYGPGLDLQTNAQGFRERQDTTLAPAPGTKRVFCIGDSFTLGYGVGNDYSWCHYLAGMQTGLETVNMGQGGYGVDQAYLWYRRDGSRFRHDVVILAVVDLDIERMRNDRFYGYPKPFLERRNGQLIVANSPLPENSFGVRAVLFRTFVSQFEASKLLDKVSVKWQRDIAAPQPRMNWQDATEVLNGILDGIAVEPGVTPIVVYLPTTFDSDSEQQISARNRAFLASATAARHIRFIDLVADRERVRRAALFPVLISASSGHYSEVGNQAVARVLHEDIAALIAPTDSASTHH
jgi:hypothetical protein